jgi:glycerophosphoinositol glycerophosphodiesterase
MTNKLPNSKDASFFSNILLGHRGCMHDELDIPENSLESLKYALAHKVDGVELDVILSLDGEMMVFHDTHTMARVCQRKGGNHMGNPTTEERISHLTKNQIQTEFVYRKGSNKDAVIPTLNEFIDTLYALDPKKVLMIEVKEYGKRASELAAKLIQTFKKYPHLYSQSVVASFNPVVLYLVRKHDPNIVTNLLVKKNMLLSMCAQVDYSPKKLYFLQKLKIILYMKAIYLADRLLYYSMVSWIPDFIGAGIIGIHNELAQDINFVKSLQSRGYKVNVWTVNTMAQKRALEQIGNIAITSDFLFDYTETTYKIPESIRRELNCTC